LSYCVQARLVHKITRGRVLAEKKRILHTAPHHDDIMVRSRRID
jgi:hypothetical protein